MSQSARIEELSDSDSDPEIDDISSLAPPSKNTSLINPSAIPSQQPPPQPTYTASSIVSKNWQTLYPVYFDVARSHNDGRRMPIDLAVANPLARTIADAAASLGLRCVFDPGKTHPRDWANPGRVKVQTRDEQGEWIAGAKGINNKRHLFRLVANYLKQRPTKPEDTLRLQIRGMPQAEEPLPAPAVPRGWKVNSIVPLHSPAVTGGGVSENFLKDMMAEMQGLPAGSAGVSKESEKVGGKKREKKKK